MLLSNPNAVQCFEAPGQVLEPTGNQVDVMA